MGHFRSGLNVFELLIFVLILGCGFLCGLGVAHLLGAGRALSFGLGAGCAFLFPVGMGFLIIESGRSERRAARREILPKAREALRMALRQQGKEAGLVEAEVNQQLPEELLEDKRM